MLTQIVLQMVMLVTAPAVTGPSAAEQLCDPSLYTLSGFELICPSADQRCFEECMDLGWPEIRDMLAAAQTQYCITGVGMDVQWQFQTDNLNEYFDGWAARCQGSEPCLRGVEADRAHAIEYNDSQWQARVDEQKAEAEALVREIGELFEELIRHCCQDCPRRR